MGFHHRDSSAEEVSRLVGILASFAAMMAVGILLYPVLKRVNGWVLAAVAVISGAACFLPYASIHNSWLALFAGSRDFTTFPILQYMVFFAAGERGYPEKGSGGKPQVLAVVLVISLPCIIQFVRDGYLPERFPPSIFYIAGGSLFVYLDYLIAGGLERLRGKAGTGSGIRLSGEMRASVSSLPAPEQSSDFALDGSSFSFRSREYAFGAFLAILLLIAYLPSAEK